MPVGPTQSRESPESFSDPEPSYPLANLAALLTVPLLAACSLTTSLEGLSDEPPVAEDAGVPIDGSTVEDARADVLGGDADGSPEEAGDAVADAHDAPLDTGDDTATDAPGDAACSTDLQNDPNHCGVCDRSCLGGACKQGECQPVIIASGQSEPTGLALDATHVYWANAAAKALKRTPKAGGAQERLDVAADGVTDPFDVAVDGTHLYWTEHSGQEVVRKPLAGGAKEHVVWGVGRCAFLTIEAGMLFVTDFRQDDPSKGNVVSSPVDGSDGMNIYFDQALAAGIDAVGQELFWARAEPSSVVRGTFDGSSSAVVASGTGTLTGLLFDGTWLYWVEDFRRVVRADLGSGTPELVYEAAAGADLVDLDGDAVSLWWTDRAAGTITRLAK